MTDIEKLRDFAQRVDDHPELELVWFAEMPSNMMGSKVVVGRPPRGEMEKWTGFEVTLQAIVEHGAERVIRCALGWERPQVLTHMARIVGYFSILKNWNRSKLAELADRHNGDYGVPHA